MSWKAVGLGLLAWVCLIAAMAFGSAALLGLLEVSSVFAGWFGLSFWKPALLALVTLAIATALNRAGKREMERAHAELIGRFARRFHDTIGQLHPEHSSPVSDRKDAPR